MNRAPQVFWGSALAVGIVFAAVVAAFFPYGAIGLHTAAERERAFLLILWTGGVLSILFGLTSILGGLGGLGFRDVAEAGSVQKAIEQRKHSARRWGEDEFHRSFDWWLVCTGALLIAGYFVAWLVLRNG
jgi:hypothetical protein